MLASVEAFNPKFGTYYLDKKITYTGFGRSLSRNKGEWTTSETQEAEDTP